MPASMPVGVDTVYSAPADAAVPDSLLHFCYGPAIPLHEHAELSFCLTTTTGGELYGVSLQRLHPVGSALCRPAALCLLCASPILSGMARLLHALLVLFAQELLAAL